MIHAVRKCSFVFFSFSLLHYHRLSVHISPWESYIYIYICLANMLSDCIGEANMQTHVLEVLELLLTKLHRRAELTKSSSAFQRMRLSRRISDMQKASSSSSLLLLTPAHFLLLTSAPPSLLLKDSIASAQPRLLSKPPWHRRL